MSETLIRSVYDCALQGMEHLPEDLLLLLLFVAAILQVIVPPVPGDMALPAMGIISVTAATSFYGLEYLVFYWLGTWCACIVVFELGRAKGATVLKSRLMRRFLPEAAVLRAEAFVQKHGGWVLLATKFLPGVNTPSVALAGTMQCSRYDAYLAMGLASFLHNGLLFMLGRWLGDNFWTIVSVLRGMSAVGLIGLGLLLIAVFYGYNRLIKRIKRLNGGGYDDE